MTQLVAPLAGRLVPLAQVPDPVFSTEMVGPGVAIDPGDGEVAVVSPVAGRLVKLHPHAFVVLSADGVGVLVHLGIDTVRLEGRGFELLAVEGASVAAGEAVVRWDPAELEPEMSPLVPVVVMDRPRGSLPVPATGTIVAAGDPLLDVSA